MTMNIQKIAAYAPSRAFAREMLADLEKMEKNMLAACPASGDMREGLERIIKAGGKRIRPLLAWTSWRLSGSAGEIVPLMTMLEIMHTSSLIHDDLVDGADVRRGVKTISSTGGGNMALRSGDHLLAAAMDYLEIYRGTGINEALSALSQEMCLGELEQQAGLYSPNTTKEDYFRRIERKTALLLAESCRCGAVAGGAGAEEADVLFDYGRHLGMAFQIRDDLTDWDVCSKSGKPPLRDLESGVITLPLIFALESGDDELAALVSKKTRTNEEIRFISELVRASGAYEKSYEILALECEKAAKALDALPDSAEKDSLLLLARSITEVKYIG